MYKPKKNSKNPVKIQLLDKFFFNIIFYNKKKDQKSAEFIKPRFGVLSIYSSF